MSENTPYWKYRENIGKQLTNCYNLALYTFHAVTT